MKRSFRDRFLTPKVARAMMSSSAILAVGAGAAAGILAGGPVGGLVGGVAAWMIRVGAAVPRNEAGPLIEPRTLTAPWRGYVERALAQRDRFWKAAERAGTGPLGTQLRVIAGRVDAGVEESWEVAQRGHALSGARAEVAVPEIAAQLRQTESFLSRGGVDADTASTYERTAEALRAQLASAQRMELIIAKADAQLRLLDARLSEAVTRVAELSARAGDVSELGSLGEDVDDVVLEMEALRQALEEASGASAAMPG